jgi:hypothetical protein
MTTITLNLEDFTKVLQRELSAELGYVDLIPGLKAGLEIDPDTLPTVPAVMLSPDLVANSNYRFNYYQYRYIRLLYFLKRDTLFEAGELDIITDAIPYEYEPDPFVVPTLNLNKRVLYNVGGDLGVELSLIQDPDSYTKFSIAFKITNALPAVFPTLRMSLIKGLALSTELS